MKKSDIDPYLIKHAVNTLGGYANVGRVLGKSRGTIKRWCDDKSPGEIDIANYTYLKNHLSRDSYTDLYIKSATNEELLNEIARRME